MTNDLSLNNLKPITLADIDLIAQIHKICFCKNSWNGESFKQLLVQDYIVGWQYNQNGFILGNLICGQAEILTVAVAPTAQRQGIGSILLNNFFSYCQKISDQDITFFLEVAINNKPAINLYKKFGFNVINIRKKYYRNPDMDAYLMSKFLGR